MGRPLKIKKIIENLSTNQGAKDIGFNALTSLTNSTVPSPVWDSATEYLGVVGGNQPPTVASADYPIVKCRVNITNSFTGEDDGLIIRQKGSHKFLVATNTAIDPANAVTGVALRIATLGDTNWQSIGAPLGATVGTVFTATGAAGAGTTGTAQEVGVCVLVDDLSPAAGNMSISYFYTDSTEATISKLTNKYLLNFAGGNPGGNANTGNAWAAAQVVNDAQFLANFFSDEGTEAKSGSETAANINLAIVQNYTS